MAREIALKISLQDESRVPEIAIVNQRQGRQDFFQHSDRVAAIEQRRVGRKLELLVVSANEIEPEGVECADPDLRRFLRRGGADPFGQFAGGPVGEGQHKD